MTILKQLDLLEELLATGGWIEGMEMTEQGQEILELLRDIYSTAEKLEGSRPTIQ